MKLTSDTKKLFDQTFSYISKETRDIIFPTLKIQKQKKHTHFVNQAEEINHFAFCLKGIYRFYYSDYNVNALKMQSTNFYRKYTV